MELGYALITEEHPPRALVDAAERAAEAGFAYLSISDHFHPWTSVQGESPFAWTVLGALADRVDLPLITAVTAPYKRYHPAIVAQAAATTAAMTTAGFTLGLGTGEALNEHVVGGEWPDPAVRLEMLEEAIAVIRELWTGKEVTHRGRYVTVDQARLYTLPESPPPIVVAAGGSDAAELAGRLGAGFMGTSPDAELIEAYRAAGGDGPIYGQATVCWADDEETARRTMHERWRHSAFDWSVNAEIPTPEGFETAGEVVREEDVTGKKPMGTDVDAYLDSMAMYAEAGYERVAIHNVGRDQTGFLRFAEVALLPAWGER